MTDDDELGTGIETWCHSGKTGTEPPILVLCLCRTDGYDPALCALSRFLGCISTRVLRESTGCHYLVASVGLIQSTEGCQAIGKKKVL